MNRRTTYIHTTADGFQEVRSRINVPVVLANLVTMIATGVGFGALIFHIFTAS